MVDRGLRMPTTVTTDGAPESRERGAGHLRPLHPDPVLVHRLANIRAKLPAETASEVLAHVYAVRDAPTLDVARATADRFANTFAPQDPAAVAYCSKTWTRCLRSTGCRCATAFVCAPGTLPSAPSRRNAAARRSSRAS